MPNSENVKDSSYGNKYLRKIKINLWTKVEICISTYSNVHVVRYSATCRTELDERNSIRQIVDRSWKLIKKSYCKLAAGHMTKQMKHGHSCDIIRSSQKSFCDFSLNHRQIVTIIMQHLMCHVLLIRMTNRSPEKLRGGKYQQVSWPVCSTHNENSVIFSCRCSVLLTTGNTVGYLTAMNKRQQMIIFYFFHIR